MSFLPQKINKKINLTRKTLVSSLYHVALTSDFHPFIIGFPSLWAFTVAKYYALFWNFSNLSWLLIIYYPSPCIMYPAPRLLFSRLPCLSRSLISWAPPPPTPSPISLDSKGGGSSVITFKFTFTTLQARILYKAYNVL